MKFSSRASVLSIVPNDERFRQLVEVATVSKAKLARYYLRAIGMSADGEAMPWFIPNNDPERINLEHVLPEDPGDNWPQFDAATAKADVHRLGNMVLLLAKQNSDLRSSSFSKKKPTYEQAPYVLTRQVGMLNDWDHAAIVSRQKSLAEYAIKTWPL